MDAEALARTYYRAIDAGDYGALQEVLAGGFVHRRPDRTIEGREEFVAFVRSGRPETETSHEVETVFVPAGGERSEAARVAVEGRLLREDGSEWFRFADVFHVGEHGLLGLRTYTDG